MKLEPLQAFAKAGSAAATTLIDRLSPDHRALMESALAAGLEVAVSLVINSSGGSRIALEVVNDDRRTRVVEVNATAAVKH